MPIVEKQTTPEEWRALQGRLAETRPGAVAMMKRFPRMTYTDDDGVRFIPPITRVAETTWRSEARPAPVAPKAPPLDLVDLAMRELDEDDGLGPQSITDIALRDVDSHLEGSES